VWLRPWVLSSALQKRKIKLRGLGNRAEYIVRLFLGSNFLNPEELAFLEYLLLK
jgi:hypothetical protein